MKHERGTPSDERELTRLYEGLARYNWWLRLLRGAKPGEGLEMHKRLAPADGQGAAEARDADRLDLWLLDILRPPMGARVLDVGCGFGATLFAWAAQDPGGQRVGLSLSPFQVRMADREAARLGHRESCTFRTGSFDHPGLARAQLRRSDASGPPGFDFVLSIESLFHSPDLTATLRALASEMERGGRLALVEDMANDAGAERSAAGLALLRHWATRRLYSREDYHAALQGAGLRLAREVDLTPRVAHRAPESRRRAGSRLRALRACLPIPTARRIVDAYLGGLALEELYATGRMSYRLLVAEYEEER